MAECHTVTLWNIPAVGSGASPRWRDLCPELLRDKRRDSATQTSGTWRGEGTPKGKWKRCGKKEMGMVVERPRDSEKEGIWYP